MGNRSDTPLKTPKMPTPLAQKFVRWLLGFGVSVSIGLSPYLGKTGIPGFSPLLSLFPLNVPEVAIPLSAFLMGVVAVVVQWLGNRRLSAQWLNKMFKRWLLVTLISFSLLLV